MTRKNAVMASVLAVGALLVLGGCKDTGETYKKSQTRSQGSLPGKQPQEYDCRKQEPKICQVPWKDKVVLYCYKGAIPKVVRYRSECK